MTENPSERADRSQANCDDDSFALPWSHIVVQFQMDAEVSRELVPSLQVVGLDDPSLVDQLPTGPTSCVLALGEGAMRAAQALRGFGVEQVFGTHVPLHCKFLSQYLEDRAAAVEYFGNAEHLHEVLNATLGGAYLLDVPPVDHPDLPRPPRIKGRPFQELLAVPAPQTLIRTVLAMLAVCVLGGASRTFKSFLVLDWHLSLYYGVAWNGLRVLPGNSVYFCGEGQAYAGKRCKAWLAHHGDRIRDIDAQGRVFEVVGEVPRLTTAEGIAELRDYLRAFVRKHGSVTLVTLDTLSVGLGGEDDENANAMLGAIVAQLGKLRTEFDCTFVLVHHFKKEAAEAGGKPSLNSLRGGAALSCNADQVFLVALEDGQQVVWLGKDKDGEDDREIARSNFQVVTLGTDEEGCPITSGVLVPVPRSPAPDEAAEIAALVKHYRQTFGDQEFTQTLAEQMKPTDMSRPRTRTLLERARETRRLPWRLQGKTVFHQAPGGLP